MIDFSARSKLAEAARALIAGRITNDQFEHRIPDSADPAIRGIYLMGFWPNYGDLTEHRMIGPARWTGERREFAVRCILFLKTDLLYVWPLHSPIAQLLRVLVNLLTFGVAGRSERRKLAAIGEVAAWPFRSQADYLAAVQSPPYLAGWGPNNSFKPKPLRGSA